MSMPASSNPAPIRSANVHSVSRSVSNNLDLVSQARRTGSLARTDDGQKHRAQDIGPRWTPPTGG